MESLSTLFLFTYGVVERTCNMVSSAAEEGLEAEMEGIFSELRSVYPIFFEYIGAANDWQVSKAKDCLCRIRKIAYDIEDAVAMKQLNQHEVGVKSASLLQKSGGSITQLRGNIRELLNIFKVAQHDRTAEYESTSSIAKVAGASLRYYGNLWLLPEGKFAGREAVKEQIIEWIFNDGSHLHPKVLSIEGEAGIGKTTLARMIYNDAVMSTRFDLLLWALSPPTCKDLKGTLVEIISSFTNQSRSHLQRMEVETLERTLRGVLAGQKYLLVLDDHKGVPVHWGEDGLFCGKSEEEDYDIGWRRLMEVFEVGLAGSTVILVSAELVYRATERWKLQGLVNDRSWSLFARCAGFDEDAEKKHPSFLTSIGRSLVGYCRGCPLAIKIVGSMLRANRDEQSWKQIKERKTWNQSTTQTAASIAFEISVEHMSGGLLQCLYLTSILTKYKVMPKDQLIFSWMALGLLHSKGGDGDGDEDEDLMHIGNRYCDELELRCFIQLFQSDGHPMVLLHKEVPSLETILGEVGYVPSYTRILETCRYLIWKGSFLYTRFAPNRTIDTVRACLFAEYIGLASQLFLKELISKLSHTRVLLLDVFKFENLPETIGGLELLRYLSLAGNPELKALPESVRNLRNLQTLDLSGCEQLQALPINMESLRHLFLSTNLSNVSGLAMRSWASLHHLKICNSPNLNSLSEEISHLTALRVLQIHDCPSIASLPNTIKLLTSLQEISILNCEKLDLTNWEGLGGLAGLQYLQIQGLPRLKKFPEGLHSAAHSLQHLVVSNCPRLTGLPEGLYKCINLVEIIIDNCPDLATLPKGIHEIKILQVMRILNCPKLFASCETRVGGDWELISRIPKIQLLQHPVYQKRPIPPLKDYPGSLSLMSKKVDYPKAGTSSQPASNALSEILDVEVLKKVSVMEQIKDRVSILFLVPEDYEIEKDTLIQLWMAAECIDDEKHGEKCFSDVLDEGYLSRRGSNFMTGKNIYRINTQKMNELSVRQNHNASSSLQWKKEYLNKPRPAESIRHVSLGCSGEIDATTFETLERFTQLRTLVFLGNHGHRAIEMPIRLFTCFKELRVLDLSRTLMKEVPGSIGHMIQLRYLDLSWTLIKWLPNTLCSLAELQTLKLTGCLNLRELPGKLKMLTKLRHLDVDVVGQLKTMPGGMRALVNLRTFSAFLVGTQDGCKIQELKELDNLSGSFCIAKLEHVKDADEAKEAALHKKMDIERLELRWTPSELSGDHNESDAIFEQLRPSTSVKELRIICYEGFKFPSWVANPGIKNIVRIAFYKCENVSELPLLEHLPFLKYLDLTKMNNIMKIERRRDWGNLGNDVAFFSLERLEIDEMQNLKTWHWQSSNQDDFRSLVQLTISGCPELEEFDLLPHLSAIKRLEITECPKLLSLSDTILPRSLQVVIIEGCPDFNPKQKLRARATPKFLKALFKKVRRSIWTSLA